MRLEPTLFQRGFLLIVIPIACQIVFVLYLFSVLNGIEQNTERERHSYELIRDAYSSFRTTTEEIVSTALSFNMGQDTDTEEKRRRLNTITKNSTKLADRIQSNPEQTRNATRLKSTVLELSDLFARAFPTTSDQAWRVSDYTNKKQRLEQTTFEFLDVLNKIVEIEEKQNATDNTAVGESIHKLVFVIVFGVVGSITVGVFLARYYSISISKPLAHLTESGKLLSQLRTLPTPMESSSLEFSQVDSLLHLVSNEVEGTLNREKEVIANAVDLICSLDRAEVFKEANPYAERMLGYRQSELIGHHLSEFAAGAELIAVIEKMRTTVETGSLATFELKMRRKDGVNIDTKWSCVWSQAHEMFFCIVNDITEQKRAEQLKLDFSDTVSDDLRSPLVSIQLILSQLLNGSHGEVSREIIQTLQKTSKNVDRLVLLANELLDFQKIKGGKMQIEPTPCDLREIIEEAVDCISIMAEPKRIKLHLSEGSFFLECDRTKILQTAVNLLSNAIKFSPMDSSIEIAITETIRDKVPELELQVIDAGPGIPEAFRQRIFEPFEQVPGAQAKVGTGLGLAICKMIAEAHGGSISVTSVDPSRGTGSIFTIKLPKIPRMS
jgi:PAS domain S-box-containing protein